MFATVIEANYIVKREDLYSTYKLTDEDREELKSLADDPKIAQKVSMINIIKIITIK